MLVIKIFDHVISSISLSLIQKLFMHYVNDKKHSNILLVILGSKLAFTGYFLV